MSSWVVGGYPGGLAFRESKDNKFADGSPFLPNYINDKKAANMTFTMSEKVQGFFNKLYKPTEAVNKFYHVTFKTESDIKLDANHNAIKEDMVYQDQIVEPHNNALLQMTEEETTMVRKHVADQKMPQLTTKVENYLRNEDK